MKSNEKGFGLIEAFITLIVVALIAGVGWVVYQRQQKAEPDKQASVSNFEECKAAGYPIMESYPEQCAANGQTFVNEAQQNKSDESSDWLSYTPPKGEYTIRIPDGWEVHRYLKESHLFSDSIAYKPGNKAKVIEDEGGRDFSHLPFGLNVHVTNDAPKKVGTISKTFVTNAGDEVVLYTSEQTEEPEGIGAPVGTKYYAFWIVKDETTIQIDHEVLVSEEPQTELVEKAIATLEIK